jgi:ankyrin repeat protein
MGSNEKLLEAVIEGNLKIVKEELPATFRGIKVKGNVDAKDEDGKTALVWASLMGHTEVVKTLLEAGADVNAKDKSGIAALIRASLGGYTEIVKILLEAGADVNAKAKSGITALIRASEDGHIETLKALVEAGADVNAKDEDGNTALIRASEDGHIETLKALVEAGADVNAKDMAEMTALGWACKDGHIETLKALVEAGADVKTKYADKALIKASLQGSAEVVTALSGTGTDDLESLAAECSELIMQYVFEATQEQLSAGRAVNQEEVTRISVNRAGEVLMRKYSLSAAEVAKIVEISASRQFR